MRLRRASTVLVGGLLAAVSATSGGACASFSGDEAPVSNDAAEDVNADRGEVGSEGDASTALDASDASADGDAHLSIACRNTVCKDVKNPVCCAVFGGASSYCTANDSCSGAITIRCDDAQDCLALGKGTSICCAVLDKPLDAGPNAITQSYCSATPCEGQSGGRAVEACSLSGSANQCHGGGTCMPSGILTFAFCE